MMLLRFLVCGVAGAMGLAAATCESLASLSLPDTTITTAASVAATANLPAYCRVAGTIRPSTDSNIRFEVWMPAQGWNGRFAGVDNGGFAGSINSDGMGGALSSGYAVASTDTGHQAGVLGAVDASWAVGHPEKITDFGYRAIHETAQDGQAITQAFYGTAASHSYFVGCSNGGREALMEAQRYPADYDGIIAGAPAYYWTHLMTGALWGNQILTASPGGYLSPAKVATIDAAIVAACDGIDGVVDGVIDDPRKCNFDPQTLLCTGAETNSCLTAAEIDTLEKLHSGPTDANGAQVFPGYPNAGAESGSNGWPLWVTGNSPGTGADYYFGYFFFSDMVYSDPTWNPATFDLNRELAAGDEAMAATLNATDADLLAFRQRGGKLILFHGWSDPAISTYSTIHYYERVIASRGAMRGEDFARLFLAPGMQHCQDGPGPNSFGQNGFARGDAGSDLESALEKWVEEGVAPEQVIASNGARTRPLCAYPAVAKWKGSGSTDDAANFTCVEPEGRPGHGPVR